MFDSGITDLYAGHNSAFAAAYPQSGGLSKPSILLNGIGNITRINNTWHNDSSIPTPYHLHFEQESVDPPVKAKRYLLRVINTSFDTTFIFSIDNHWLQIISADFVPIEPYYNTSVLIGIGQRYNLVVEARPDSLGNEINPLPADANFWIRTFVADGCGENFTQSHYEEAGILRYDNTSTALPTSSHWPNITRKCSDENYENLKPIFPWSVGNPSNGEFGQEWSVFGNRGPNKSQPFPTPEGFPLAFFSLEPDGANAFKPSQ